MADTFERAQDREEGNGVDVPSEPSVDETARRGDHTVSRGATDATNQKTDPLEFPIVGVGASAGGLEALEHFFEHMPSDSGMAFVVIQHLSPDFKSVMDELLARHTQIAIHRVSDGMRVEPDAIYLIPAKKEMAISDGKLRLTDKDPSSALTLPIDTFFRSLAQDVGSRAIGIVLSGTGSDGSRGVCDIHEVGGLVIAEDPESAKFDGMPRNAAETGIVDLVLRPEEMPNALLSYIDNGEVSPVATSPRLLEGMDAIFQLLRKSYDIDFSYYKRTTVGRRVQRRLAMNQITDLEEYVDQLRDDPNELNSLYRDLLIGVTKFFRDTEAFQRLEKEVLPQLMLKVRPEAELRIWVAGCATGEEAYSLAILVHEQMERMNQQLNVKIFASDVHRDSLDIAGAGHYSEASLSEVSPERLARYFTRSKTGYQVSQEIRQMIVFAPHNVIKDAPFTKIDLLTCRNLLIYLEPLAQKKALALFHFALNRGGVMFMGPSESPGELSDEFDSIDDRWKLYRKRRDKRLAPDMRLPLSAGYSRPRGMSPVSASPAPSDAPILHAYEELTKDYAPPSFLINERRELVQSYCGASRYLRMRDGQPSVDVFELVLPDLKIPLTTAVHQAGKKQAPVTYRGIRVESPAGSQQITLTVKPVPAPHAEREHFLATLESVDAPPQPADESESMRMDLEEASQEQIEVLESELRYTKENLQATVEEMEASNEELQATNEELIASNEELQSTNEELHSVNEELYTVNAEYHKKIGELTQTTADLDNLLHSTDVGVIFLDRELCIRKFTPKMGETFHLLPIDVGRPIDHFAHKIDRPNLQADIKRVLDEGVPLETEVIGGDSQSFLLRLLPYRSKTGEADGVVLTLVDVTRLKEAESELRLMSKVFLNGADPIIILDLEGTITDMNAEAERAFGWSREEMLGNSIDALTPPSERQRAHELRARCVEQGQLRNIETTRQSKNGDVIPVLQTLCLLTDHANRPVAIASSAKDITDRKQALETARDAVRRRDQFLAMLSHELRNPLGAALNATYVLEQLPRDQLPKEVADACGVIQRQTLQVARLLDDLLDVSRVTQGKIEIRKDIVDLTELVSDAVEAVQPMMQSRRHTLKVDVAPVPVYVEGEASRLLEIQENLLTNAAKYTPSGGEIHLAVLKEDDHAVIRVSDNGEGIPPHTLESIFELFVQSDDTLDRAHGGMGLGLTLVKRLVELHGGQVTAHSEGLGKGSQFVVRLPLTGAPAPNGSPKRQRSELRVGQRHIVIVEDNEDSGKMLEALLQLDGHRISVAGDGRKGLEMIRHLRPEVAIVDIGLPELSGYQVARQIRQEFDNGDICLIALTGYGRDEDRAAVRQAGFDAHLVKPLNPEELTSILSSLHFDRSDDDPQNA